MAISFAPKSLSKFRLDDENYLAAKRMEELGANIDPKAGWTGLIAKILLGKMAGDEKRASGIKRGEETANRTATMNTIQKMMTPPTPMGLNEQTIIAQNDDDYGMPQARDSRVVEKPFVPSTQLDIANVLMGSKYKPFRAKGLELKIQNLKAEEERKNKLRIAQGVRSTTLTDKRNELQYRNRLNEIRDYNKSRTNAIVALNKGKETQLSPSNVERLLPESLKFTNKPTLENLNNLTPDQYMPQVRRGGTFTPSAEPESLTQDQIRLQNRFESPEIGNVQKEQAPNTPNLPTITPDERVNEFNEPPSTLETASDGSGLAKIENALKNPNFQNSVEYKNLTTPSFTNQKFGGIGTSGDQSQPLFARKIDQIAYNSSVDNQQKLINLIPLQRDANGETIMQNDGTPLRAFTLASPQGKNFIANNPTAQTILGRIKAQAKAYPKTQQALKAKKLIISATTRLARILSNMSRARGQTMRPGQTAFEQASGAIKMAVPPAATKIFGSDETVEYQDQKDKIETQQGILLNFIRKASEQGARGLDSNKELDFYKKGIGEGDKNPYNSLYALIQLDTYYGNESMGGTNSVRTAIGEPMYKRIMEQSSLIGQRLDLEEDREALKAQINNNVISPRDIPRAQLALGALTDEINEITNYQKNFSLTATRPRTRR
jgi:hypothetical protein